MSNLFCLKGKRIVITGASGLIGREVADAYAEAGAALMLLDLNAPEGLAGELSSKHGVQAHGRAVDVSDEQAVGTVFAETVRLLGGIDVLVHLAAIDAKFDATGLADIPAGDLRAFPFDAWQRSVDVNVTGTFLVCREVMRHMTQQGHGNVILVASTYSMVSPTPALYVRDDVAVNPVKPADYVATKSVIPNFTRYLASHYGRDGVRVNCIAPHGIENNHPEWFHQNFAKFSPLGRMCRKDEVRGPFVFLASDASSYMTGSALMVDGGWTAW